MRLRDSFIHSLNIDNHLKLRIKDSAKHMQFNSMLNILVELTKPAYKTPMLIPKEYRLLASGYPFVLHACIILFDEETAASCCAALHEKRDSILEKNSQALLALKTIEKDREIWNVIGKKKFLYKLFENCHFTEDDFAQFEQLMLKHRSYGLIPHQILSTYTDDSDTIVDIVTNIIKGFGYFYDVVPYDKNSTISFSLLYTKHIMLSQYDMDCSYSDYHNLQKYMMASGVYSFMLEKAADFFAEAYNAACALEGVSGKRLFILRRLVENAHSLIEQCEASLA